MDQRLETVSTRLSFTLITASIIIGSALIVLSDQEGVFGPYIFLVSVFLGMWLIYIMMRKES